MDAPIAKEPLLLGTGAYGLSEAARLARVAPVTARRWFIGPARVLDGHVPPAGDDRAINFLDLIDLLVVGRLRGMGHSLQRIRKACDVMRRILHPTHPFADQRILADPDGIFLETLGHQRGPAKQLCDATTGQLVFRDILRPYLQQVDYEAGLARRWRIAKGVVIDPARAFGKPVTTVSTISTHVLAHALKANGDNVELVADLFEVDPQTVRDAAGFEELLAARAA